MQRKLQRIAMAVAIAVSAGMPIFGCHRGGSDSVRTPTISDFVQALNGSQGTVYVDQSK